MKAWCLLLLTGLLVTLFLALTELPPPEALRPVAWHYVNLGVADTGAVNLVNAVLFDYRGFDTLGEATVIFTAAAAFKMLFDSRRAFYFQHGMSEIVKSGMAIFSPIIFLFGCYLILAGHLSPGGAFQGGVVLAAISVVITVAYGLWYQLSRTVLRPRVGTAAESACALLFVFIGLLGIVSDQYFLSNLTVFPAGVPGQFFSAGSIPLLNIASGIKVGAGFYLLFYSFAGGD